jgi:hypothetical protein
MRKAIKYIIFITIYLAAGLGIFYASHYLITHFISNKKCPAGKILDGNYCREECVSGKKFWPNYGCLECPIGETKNITGQCVADVCSDGQELCGDSCIFTSTHECLNKKIPCKKSTSDCKHKYKDKKGNLACCTGCVATKDKNDTCCDISKNPNQVTGKCDKCPSTSKMCNGKCCPFKCDTINHACCTRDQLVTSNGCCDPLNTHTKKKTGDQVCCPTFSDKDDRCCADFEDLDNDNRCGVKCGLDDKGKPVYCKPKADEKGNVQSCFKRHFGGKLHQACVNTTCITSNVSPETDPPNVHQKAINKDAKIVDNGLPVCNLKSKLMFCHNDGTENLSSATRSISSTFDATNCTDYDCINMFKDLKRVEKLDYNANSGHCKATDNCLKLLPNCTEVDYSNTNIDQIQGKSLSICRTGDDVLTGQICPDNQICELDDFTDTHICIKGYDLKTIDPVTENRSLYDASQDGTMLNVTCESVPSNDQTRTGQFRTRRTCEEKAKNIACPYTLPKDTKYKQVYSRNTNNAKTNGITTYGCYRYVTGDGSDGTPYKNDKEKKMTFCHNNRFGYKGVEKTGFCYLNPTDPNKEDADSILTLPQGGHVCVCPGCYNSEGGWGSEPTLDSAKLVCTSSNYNKDSETGYKWYQCTNPAGCAICADSDGCPGSDTVFYQRYDGPGNFCPSPDKLDDKNACGTCKEACV